MKALDRQRMILDFQHELDCRIYKARQHHGLGSGVLLGWADPRKIIEQMEAEGWTLPDDTTAEQLTRHDAWLIGTWLGCFIGGLILGIWIGAHATP